MLETAFASTTVFLSSHGDGSGGILGLLAVGPVLAFIFYRTMLKKYRNFDKTHDFEGETSIVHEKVQALDEKVGERNRTRDKYITGKNSDNHRLRVQEF